MRFRVFARAILCATSFITIRIYALRTLMALGKPHFVGILSLKRRECREASFPKPLPLSGRIDTIDAHATVEKRGGFLAYMQMQFVALM